MNDIIFPKREIEKHYFTFRNKVSDWFPSDKILNDGEFSFTQLVDTNKPNSISYCESKKYVNLVNSNKAINCVIVSRDLRNAIERPMGIVISKYPSKAFFDLHNRLNQTIVDKPFFKPHIQNSAKIHPTAFVDKNCFLGNEVIVGPGAIVLNNAYIDDNVVLGPNVVIGSEGLEFKRRQDGTLSKVTHIGGVYISCDVEIMANSVVSKDVYFGYTLIGSGTKIGPLCNISHRASIGQNCRIAGNTTIAGSAQIGEDVWLGPSTTISNGINIGDHAKIALGSVVVKDVESHKSVSGFFAMAHSSALKVNAFLRSKGT